MVHAVGRASNRLPRLIDLVWSNPKHPRLTLVGKGICFDTGGLALKPPAGMLLMKKDMGGGDGELGMATATMTMKLTVPLRGLIDAVEHSVSGNDIWPGEGLPSPNGMHIQKGKQ